MGRGIEGWGSLGASASPPYLLELQRLPGLSGSGDAREEREPKLHPRGSRNRIARVWAPEKAAVTRCSEHMALPLRFPITTLHLIVKCEVTLEYVALTLALAQVLSQGSGEFL